jgi:hypothetical protein
MELPTTWEEYAEMFLETVKVVRPQHKHYHKKRSNSIFDKEKTSNFYNEESPEFPDYSFLTVEKIRKGDKPKPTNTYLATCGPRRGTLSLGVCHENIVDASGYSDNPYEFLLVLWGHEMTHLTEGTSYYKSGHPPAFWNEMAYNMQIILDKYPVFEEKWDVDLDPNAIKEIAVDDPNYSMVDHRSETTSEVRDRMRKYIQEYTPLPHKGEDTPDEPSTNEAEITIKAVEVPQETQNQTVARSTDTE